MRLAIVNLTGGNFSGGYKKYLKNMLPRLAEHNAVDSLLCVSPEGQDIADWFSKPPAADHCSCSSLALSHLAYIPDRKMAACLKKFSPDIVFMPVDRYIRFKGVPVVNMVRNMEPFVPNMKGDTPQEKVKKYIQRKLTCNSIRLANHTIAVSDFVKDYLTATLHVPENKVSKIYHGLTPPTKVSSLRPATVPIGWDSGFLFTCGSIRPARGLEDALGALNDLKTRNRDLRLVIAGETMPGLRKYRDGLEQFIVSRDLTDNICWAGELSDEEMRWCYDQCSLLIMTSRIEACPNIALEAMSYGAIAIAADNPPLPEFFSDGASYYQAGNGRSLAEAVLDRLALEPGDRCAISEQSRKRSLTFSWDLTADKTMAVLMQMVKRLQNRQNQQS